MTHKATRPQRTGRTVRRPLPPLSLRETVPQDWHHDRPAFAGDPFMDWESRPEPPIEPNLRLAEKRPRVP